MSSLAILKGASGTGKGTRVYQLIRFLKTLYEPVEYKFISGGRIKTLGLYFKGLNIFFVGTNVVSNKSGLESWSSLDYINAATGKTDLTLNILKLLLEQNFNVVAEGEPMLISYKYRFLWVLENLKPNSMFFSYYMYKDRGEYDTRIMGRSGKVAGSTGWERNEGYLIDYRKNRLEKPPQGDHRLYMSKYDENIALFGEKYLEFVSHQELIPRFVEYSRTTNCLRSVNKEISSGI